MELLEKIKIGKIKSSGLDTATVLCQPIFPVAKNEKQELEQEDYIESELINLDFDHSINKADKLDCEIAVCSGIISGIVDSFFVGKFSLDKINEWGDKKVEEFVIHIAKSKGCKSRTGEVDIYDAIVYLEGKFKIAADPLENEFGGGRWHHLKDFTHHFPLGLVFSILTQFTEKVYGVDIDGNWKKVPVGSNELIGKTIEEKFTYGFINWFFHMVSDMAGSHGNAGQGTGIPGILVSLLKECSSMPIFKELNKKHDAYEWIDHLFNGTLLGEKNENGKVIKQRKFDLRAEIGLLRELGKQSLPVLLNECIVSACYFIRRLMIEIKDCNVTKLSEITKINGEDVLPFNNPAIARMRTISRGVFTAFDMSDAAIRAGLKCEGSLSKFAIDFALHINVVGVGSFIYAVGKDIKINAEEEKAYKEKYNKELRKFEESLLGFECVSLTEEQRNLLYSLESLSVEYDIRNEKKEKDKNYKKLWLQEWKNYLSNSNINFLSENEVISICLDDNKQKQLDLALINYLSFKPYCLIPSDLNEKYKKLRIHSKYIEDVICENQTYFSLKEYKELKKKYEKTLSYINGSSQRKNTGAIATVATVAATGVASFFLAPVIAPVAAAALFSETVAGLSGCALTSASLAAFGGGSLAIGGLGMAGGTMVIAGSGAAIGAAGSSGINSLVSLVSKESSALIVEKTARTVLFSETVLKNKLNDEETIKNIINSFSIQIEEMDKLIAKMKEELKETKSKKAIKEKIKVTSQNKKALINGNKALQKLVN